MPQLSSQEVRLGPYAMAAVEKIASGLGVSPGEAVARALGLELYLLRYADGSNSVIIENEAGIRTRMVLRHGP